jgi:hypothetical protein
VEVAFNARLVEEIPADELYSGISQVLPSNKKFWSALIFAGAGDHSQAIRRQADRRWRWHRFRLQVLELSWSQ